jgi:GNAT superfamily N-acetyltransferase
VQVLGRDSLSVLLISVQSQTRSRNSLSIIVEKINITRISEIQLGSINHLAEESLRQGFLFIERLIREYRSGFNCFDKHGEVLLIASAQGAVVGIGGLNRDPYFNDPKVGRLRHLYVESAWRRHGVGRLLVTHLIHEANQYYQLLTLRTDTVTAAEFYQKLGFKTDPNWEHTTHHLQLGDMEYSFLNLH